MIPRVRKQPCCVEVDIWRQQCRRSQQAYLLQNQEWITLDLKAKETKYRNPILSSIKSSSRNCKAFSWNRKCDWFKRPFISIQSKTNSWNWKYPCQRTKRCSNRGRWIWWFWWLFILRDWPYVRTVRTRDKLRNHFEHSHVKENQRKQ